MKLTIIKEDGFVAIDGVGYIGLDLSFLPGNIHAVQWYHTKGEIEFVCEPLEPKPENQLITSIDQFQEVIDLWNAKDYEVKNPPPPPPPTREELDKQIEYATSRRLHDFATTRQYDSAVSCVSYINSTNEGYAKEAEYMISARDLTWNKVYSILNEIKSGVRPDTTTFDDIESELPVLNWPT